MRRIQSRRLSGIVVRVGVSLLVVVLLLARVGHVLLGLVDGAFLVVGQGLAWRDALVSVGLRGRGLVAHRRARLSARRRVPVLRLSSALVTVLPRLPMRIATPAFIVLRRYWRRLMVPVLYAVWSSVPFRALLPRRKSWRARWSRVVALPLPQF